LFNEEELHYHLSGALKKLHDLMECEDAEIALEATKSLAQLIMEIQFRETEQQTADLLEQLESEQEEDYGTSDE
jgi:hypothetical protein